MERLSSTLPNGLKWELEKSTMSGVAKFKDVIENQKSEWKKISINIAITGPPGVGKSSFINSIRKLTADDKGSAPVGPVKTKRRKRIKSYKYPSNENVILWDLPGVGTPNFPLNTYLKKVQFGKFDFFVILSAGRFQEADILLAKEIRNLNKNVLFVRTQMHAEIEKDKDAHLKTHDKSKLIKQIRDDCQKCLEEFGITESSVFLIDSYKRLEFDFEFLATTLIDKALEQKKESMTLSMTLLTSSVLQNTFEILNNRIMWFSILSALAEIMPIPEEGTVLFHDHFKQQFGLDANIMEEYALLLKTETPRLGKRLCLKILSIAGTAKCLVQKASRAITGLAVEHKLPILIPLISCAVSAGVTYAVTKASLKYFLKLCYEDAMKINQELMRNALN